MEGTGIVSVINKKTLEERAAELWKDNPMMQEKWIAAVCLTRQTKRGWILDKQVERVSTK
jgi:hypothetical protein